MNTKINFLTKLNQDSFWSLVIYSAFDMRLFRDFVKLIGSFTLIPAEIRAKFSRIFAISSIFVPGKKAKDEHLSDIVHLSTVLCLDKKHSDIDKPH